MEPTLLRFVWRHSRRQQIAILATTVATLPLLYLSLELPKIIVNEAITGVGFPRRILGETIERLPYLFGLCGLFLASVIAINALKYLMNIAIGMCGERMLRRLRYSLVERAMRLPPARFRATDPGEVVQTVIAETEPLGGFVGELISTPAYQGGMLAVFVGFIFAQDPLLGLSATALIPVQAAVIPRMQRRVVRLNRERAANQRRVAEAISEPAIAFDEVVANGAAMWRLARLSARLHANTMIRLQIYRRKFVIKLLSNVLNQITPFFFFSIGGWLVIEGRLEIGALVAVLAAYKDIAKPWRELLNYYQRLADFRGRYAFIIGAFPEEETFGRDRIDGGASARAPLAPPLVFADVEAAPGGGGLTVERLILQAGVEAVVEGGTDAARSALLRLAAGLEAPARGRVTLGGRDVASAALTEIGAAIGYVPPEPALLRGPIRENLLYGLYRSPPALDPSRHRDAWREARATGAPGHHAAGDWTDYAAAGVDGAEALAARVLEVAERVGLSDELLAAALDARLPPEQAARWAGPMREARRGLRTALAERDLADAVAPWRRDAFNRDASLLDNLLFAASKEGETTAPPTAALLRESGADRLLAEAGWALAAQVAEVVETVGRDSGVLDSLGGFSRADLLAVTDIHETNAARGLGGVSTATRASLIAFGAAFVPARDRFEIADARLEARILEMRTRLAPAVAARRDAFTPFDSDAVAPGLSVARNLLGGVRRHTRRTAWRALDRLMREAAVAAGLGGPLVDLGLEAPTGPGAPLDFRRRVALVRALLKRPSVVILCAGETEAAEAVRALAPQAILLRPAAGEEPDRPTVRLRVGPDGALEAVGSGREAAAQ